MPVYKNGQIEGGRGVVGSLLTPSFGPVLPHAFCFSYRATTRSVVQMIFSGSPAAADAASAVAAAASANPARSSTAEAGKSSPAAATAKNEEGKKNKNKNNKKRKKAPLELVENAPREKEEEDGGGKAATAPVEKLKTVSPIAAAKGAMNGSTDSVGEEGERKAETRPRRKKRRGKGKGKRIVEQGADASDSDSTVAASSSSSSSSSMVVAELDVVGGCGEGRDKGKGICNPPRVSASSASADAGADAGGAAGGAACVQKKSDVRSNPQQKDKYAGDDNIAEDDTPAAIKTQQQQQQPATKKKKRNNKRKNKKKKKKKEHGDGNGDGEDEEEGKLQQVAGGRKEYRRNWELSEEESVKMAPWMYLGVELHPALLWHLNRQVTTSIHQCIYLDLLQKPFTDCRCNG